MRATAGCTHADGGGVERQLDRLSPAGPAKEMGPEELLAASLASCTAATMELYARRKGWEVGRVEVEVDYAPSRRGSPTCCTIVVRLPETLSPEQRERLMQVGATSGIHRTLEGEVLFDERVELTRAPEATTPEPGFGEPRRRISLLNGLRRVGRA